MNNGFGYTAPMGNQDAIKPAMTGYNAAMGNLNKSLKSVQGSDSSQLMQAQQSLQQNQGKVQQGLINSGLGNTTVAQTMQQAPLQTYNQQVAGIHNNTQMQQMKGYENLAGLQSQGGMDISRLLLALQSQQQQQAAEAQKGSPMPYMGTRMNMFGQQGR